MCLLSKKKQYVRNENNLAKTFYSDLDSEFWLEHYAWGKMNINIVYKGINYVQERPMSIQRISVDRNQP